MFDWLLCSLSLSCFFSSSVSGIFFSQASVPNTNPFLDDSDVHGGNTEKVVHLGDTAERSEKKRCAPMPPQNKTQMGKPDVPPEAPAIPETTQDFPSRASEDGGDSDSCSLRRDKRPAPLPPKNKQEVQNAHADQTTSPLHTGEWRTTRFQEIDQTNKVCPVLQKESRTSDADYLGTPVYRILSRVIPVTDKKPTLLYLPRSKQLNTTRVQLQSLHYSQNLARHLHLKLKQATKQVVMSIWLNMKPVLPQTLALIK